MREIRTSGSEGGGPQGLPTLSGALPGNAEPQLGRSTPRWPHVHCCTPDIQDDHILCGRLLETFEPIREG